MSIFCLIHGRIEHCTQYVCMSVRQSVYPPSICPTHVSRALEGQNLIRKLLTSLKSEVKVRRPYNE